MGLRTFEARRPRPEARSAACFVRRPRGGRDVVSRPRALRRFCCFTSPGARSARVPPGYAPLSCPAVCRRG